MKDRILSWSRIGIGVRIIVGRSGVSEFSIGEVRVRVIEEVFEIEVVVGGNAFG